MLVHLAFEERSESSRLCFMRYTRAKSLCILQFRRFAVAFDDVEQLQYYGTRNDRLCAFSLHLRGVLD
jgi:hypothetical protein